MTNVWHVYTTSSTCQWMYVFQDYKFQQVGMNRGSINCELDKQRVELYALMYALCECKRIHGKSLYSSYFKLYCSNYNTIKYIINWYVNFFKSTYNQEIYSKTLMCALIKLYKDLMEDNSLQIEILPQLF